MKKKGRHRDAPLITTAETSSSPLRPRGALSTLQTMYRYDIKGHFYFSSCYKSCTYSLFTAVNNQAAPDNATCQQQLGISNNHDQFIQSVSAPLPLVRSLLFSIRGEYNACAPNELLPTQINRINSSSSRSADGREVFLPRAEE